ncbi:MAG: hypothetical protein KJ939_05695 [Nanoarchaeota archaeon]|nr:hypothetical protein [Nanoarchaeota archaeon]MBU4352542.1 hypothetical protein [Nanoarchaeota archaeon]
MKDIDPLDLFDDLVDEFEKYKNNEQNEYSKAYKKVRTWCKLYKKGLYPNMPDLGLDNIIKKIADDEDILEELLDVFYDFNTKDMDEYLKDIENLSRKFGFDDLRDLLNDIIDGTDTLDDYFPDD